jgi:hypothetical protein
VTIFRAVAETPFDNQNGRARFVARVKLRRAENVAALDDFRYWLISEAA